MTLSITSRTRERVDVIYFLTHEKTKNIFLLGQKTNKQTKKENNLFLQIKHTQKKEFRKIIQARLSLTNTGKKTIQIRFRKGFCICRKIALRWP